MEKTQIKDFPFVAVPVVLVATEENGRMNFAPHAQYGAVAAEPPIVYISVIKEHLTAQNILKTKTFSINIPDKTLLEKLIYCGNTSGLEQDKSKAFKTFYSKIRVPLIEECKINYVCELVRTVEINCCYMFLGEIKETYIANSCLSGETPDIAGIDPLLASIGGKFWTINELKYTRER
ncbi:MAG: flavin reductase family protein [Clostridiales bacterium]|jgi:flavin reductase (DIM6/NTAB) family NADH-FMN oxidoreductase RutF|nr:flavin reductase family protein [Clostridiales bacterium]